MLVWGLFFFFLLKVNDSKSVLSLMTSEYSKFCLDINLDHLKVMETTSVIALKQFSGKLTLYEAPHEKKIRTESGEKLLFVENGWFFAFDKSVRLL